MNKTKYKIKTKHTKHNKNTPTEAAVVAEEHNIVNISERHVLACGTPLVDQCSLVESGEADRDNDGVRVIV